ncbi:hypothetical protein PFLA_a3666 [Pseudoalteromonas flavipulchra NCIMB 2033 = ATCC BAA-314]|nr:hypothetical protein [Pseudoalteromonas flavipulchra NCIMB 2033 = ATCC BAA-314]
MEVNSTQLALKLAARKALIIRSSGYLAGKLFCLLILQQPYQVRISKCQ